jgi:hypothetical protein
MINKFALILGLYPDNPVLSKPKTLFVTGANYNRAGKNNLPTEYC